MIDFQLTEAQKQIREQSRAYAGKVLAGAHLSYESKPTQAERFQAIAPIYRIAVENGLIKGVRVP